MSEQETTGNTTVYVYGEPVTLTDEQERVRTEFRGALASWLARHADDAERALFRSGLPTIASNDVVFGVVYDLVENGWSRYADQ